MRIYVRFGDDSIDVADLVGENQLDVGRALDVGCIVGSARLTTRTITANVRSACRYGGGGDGRHNKNVRSDRPADRSDKRQAASPRTSQGSITLAFPLARRRCNEGRMARRFEQPRLASPRSMPLSCHRWRVAVRGRVTGAGVKVPRLHHGEAETGGRARTAATS